MPEEGLVKMQDQFAGLDMSNLIGAPLKAACEAQTLLAASTAQFIENVGFDTDANNKKILRTTSFSFKRATTDEVNGGLTTEEVSMDVPLLSIVKIPTLAVDTVDITFDMEVKSSTSSTKTSDKTGELEANAGVRIGPFHMDVKVKGSIACHEANTRTSDNSAKYHVQVHASDQGIPEGLAKMLDVIATASAPTAIGAAKSDTPSKPEPTA